MRCATGRFELCKFMDVKAQNDSAVWLLASLIHQALLPSETRNGGIAASPCNRRCLCNLVRMSTMLSKCFFCVLACCRRFGGKTATAVFVITAFQTWDIMSPATEPAKLDLDQCTAVFFARVPPPVPYDDLLALFRQYGEVKNLNLYRRWATAKTSKGCGIVVYSSCSEAKAALEALNGMKPFEGYPGCDMPMVVEYVDASRITPPGGERHHPTHDNILSLLPSDHKSRQLRAGTTLHIMCTFSGHNMKSTLQTCFFTFTQDNHP